MSCFILFLHRIHDIHILIIYPIFCCVFCMWWNAIFDAKNGKIILYFHFSLFHLNDLKASLTPIPTTISYFSKWNNKTTHTNCTRNTNTILKFTLRYKSYLKVCSNFEVYLYIHFHCLVFSLFCSGYYADGIV